MSAGRCITIRRTSSGRWQVQRLKEAAAGAAPLCEITAIYSGLQQVEDAVRQQLRNESLAHAHIGLPESGRGRVMPMVAQSSHEGRA